MSWHATILTLYPEMFPGVLGHSLTGKALKDRLWHLTPHNIRPHGLGRHRVVDDTPAGGGAGMVLRADVLDAAICAAGGDGPLIALTPRGRPFDQACAARLAAGPGLRLLCGRFEGIDQRVLDHHRAEEISIGDYVLTGGELAAQVLIDACVRLIPGVLGNFDSAREESFSHGLLEHPHYTRPPDWAGHAIPEVLLSGHHGRIAAWRHQQAEAVTCERRPDLWRAYRNDTDPTEDPRALGPEQPARSTRDMKD